ncbi:MAG: tannase/feruloyl esterase family alpha/beta hydrolase [Luteitalea sp.]|nr:tannase/feruloyl esterase family alpha/beta hydrolase [Luteitalea sp.]
MKISVFRLILATSRATASPFLRPNPGSITSVAREPTTMPTFGTSGTLASGMTYVWSASLTVAFSFTSGSGTAPRWAAALEATRQNPTSNRKRAPGFMANTSLAPATGSRRSNRAGPATTRSGFEASDLSTPLGNMAVEYTALRGGERFEKHGPGGRDMAVSRGLLLVLVVASLMSPAPGQSSPAARTSGSPSQRPSFIAAASCKGLASLTLPNATITLARRVDAGAFTPSAPAGSAAPPAAAAQAFRVLPAFCRVAATLRPSSDSDIKIELWMPAAEWNGKFQAVGNGAFMGSIPYAAMATALGRGYATGSTDTGHAGGGAAWAVGHPEKLIDYGWRAVHELAVTSKKILASYYEAGPQFSYWNGCSAGGRQGLKEAQRFPSDFDGIIAGAPGLDWTGRAAQAVRIAQVLEKTDAARLSQAERQLLHGAVIEACDALDGVKDGLLESPQRCTFDPGVLQCKGSDRAACLTAPQVETARLMYSSAVNPKTKREIAGLERGSELGWTDLGWTGSARATGLDQFRFLVFGDPTWDVQKFDFHSDIVRAEESDTINALDPNLKPFIDRGGKLVQYHGWSDPQIAPGNSTQYYTRVLEALGRASEVHDSYRLFMAPGMAHCGGGEGPNRFDMVSALEQWVEHGRAPDQIVASLTVNGTVARTRPLCPYPQVAAYKGTGSADEAANFVCTAR